MQSCTGGCPLSNGYHVQNIFGAPDVYPAYTDSGSSFSFALQRYVSQVTLF